MVCTVGLGVGSEVLQSLLPNGRDFDLYDIVANIFGSLAAVGLCAWYHKRMLERKRAQKGYGAVAGEDTGEDVELAGSIGGQESGVVDAGPSGDAGRTLEEEVDNWDENAVDDWDDDDDAAAKGKAHVDIEDDGQSKKRAD